MTLDLKNRVDAIQKCARSNSRIRLQTDFAYKRKSKYVFPDIQSVVNDEAGKIEEVQRERSLCHTTVGQNPIL